MFLLFLQSLPAFYHPQLFMKSSMVLKSGIIVKLKIVTKIKQPKNLTLMKKRLSQIKMRKKLKSIQFSVVFGIKILCLFQMLPKIRTKINSKIRNPWVHRYLKMQKRRAAKSWNQGMSLERPLKLAHCFYITNAMPRILFVAFFLFK